MRSILTGLLFLVSGLMGTHVLRGTNSSGALVVVGLILMVVGTLSVASRVNEGAQDGITADDERDAEQYAEYVRARDALAKKTLEVKRKEELERLLAEAPHARAQVDAVLSRAGDGLSDVQRHALAVDLARRAAVSGEGAGAPVRA
jgi:hypothetical protein